ncbi:SMP-30/gluconolactonase/LRE family protein [Streptomyces sp. CA-210063]|uniref:SMP-30/gluconolactonase/LRE family protein n=1 Tax=Streptomyces sp. CA-210063 TaxID=2801029 RepID=UPI00214C884F|nr:SMP-30/gluconolactonase/LRE family protein [Streptomyces sp. CA-210063]UUU36642.1 SMP-30/gluconolactonase/LRE family protein [Streptomyces sp. CA-210063]
MGSKPRKLGARATAGGLLACLVLSACGSGDQDAQADKTDEARTPSATASASADTNCKPSRDGRITPVCNLQSPEDFQLLPGSENQMVVSLGNGPVYKGPSSLALLDTDTKAVTKLAVQEKPLKGWGDAGCTPPEGEFSFHGLNVQKLKDGTVRVLVVNHSKRESVELFQLDRSTSRPKLMWRGCVKTPPESYINDVAGLPDGGFVVTVMASAKDMQPEGFDSIFSGKNTGPVYRWSPTGGVRTLPGTMKPGPNGVQVSADGRTMHFAEYTGFKMARYDLEAEKMTGEANLDIVPDNVSMGPDGELVMVGVATLAETRECPESGLTKCDHPVRVQAVDPDSLKVTDIPVDGLNVLRGATVAVPAGDALYVSSVANDRIVRFTYDGLKGK